MDMGSILSSVISSPRVNVCAAQRFHVNKDAAESLGGLLPCCLFQSRRAQRKSASILFDTVTVTRRGGRMNPLSLIIIPQRL